MRWLRGVKAHYSDERATIYHGDCIEVMRSLPDNSVDSVVTDPPYGLEFMGKDWDAPWKRSGDVEWVEEGTDASHPFRDGSARIRFGLGGEASYGFQLWFTDVATEALRVLKPGGHLLAFGGTRTWHRLAVGIEDAGFEIRDSIAWQHMRAVFCQCHAVPYINDRNDLRGVSEDVHDIRSMDEAGEESDVQPTMQRQSEGSGLGDSRAQGSGRLDGSEQSVVQKENVGATESSVEGRRDLQKPEGELQGSKVRSGTGLGEANGAQGRLHNGASPSNGRVDGSPADSNRSGESQGSQPQQQLAGESGTVPDERGSQTRGGWPICGRCDKPLEPPFDSGPLAWQYGSGFPKSLDVSKAIDKRAGAQREVVGIATSWNRPDSKDGDTARMNVSPAEYNLTAPATP